MDVLPDGNENVPSPETKLPALRNVEFVENAFDVVGPGGVWVFVECVGEERLFVRISGRREFDLAILDFAMPGMTGAELSKRARVIDTALPIVFASGYAETAALERAADGRTFVLRKPFRLSELQRTLSLALQR